MGKHSVRRSGQQSVDSLRRRYGTQQSYLGLATATTRSLDLPPSVVRGLEEASAADLPPEHPSSDSYPSLAQWRAEAIRRGEILPAPGHPRITASAFVQWIRECHQWRDGSCWCRTRDCAYLATLDRVDISDAGHVAWFVRWMCEVHQWMADGCSCGAARCHYRQELDLIEAPSFISSGAGVDRG